MNKLKELINKLCPNGVEYKNIQELCKISRGKVMSKDFIKSNAGEYPVYSSQTENNGELGKISTYDFDGEYLTWTTDGANAGSVFYRKGKFSVTNVCGLLEVKNKVMIPKFLYYVLSIEAPKYVNAGMGNPKLMSNVMAKIKVPVPPLEVQCEIVHILDDFTLLSAELSAELKARKKQYEYYKKTLFENKNIELKTLKELATNCDNKRKPITSENREKGEYPYYGASGIVDYVKGYIFDGDYLLISEDGANLVARKTPIAFSISGKNWVNNHAHVLKFSNMYLQKYVEMYLNYINIEQYISGAAQPKLNQVNLNKIVIPIPNNDTLKNIVDILLKFDKITNDISEGLPAEIEARQKQYEYYRDKLLTFKELKVNE